MTSTPKLSRAAAVWTVIGLMLLTVNLRAAITGISPLLGDLRNVFGLSGVEVSILTTLPVLCLGVFASLAPVFARRVGVEPVIAASLVMITLGIVLRVVPSRIALFGGTVLAGAGIALGNVLLPAVIKRYFPGRVGSLTGVTMMVMAASGAIAAGLAVPLHDSAGWRIALAVWAVPSLIAALAWGPTAVRAWRHANEASSVDPVDEVAAGRETRGSLLRAPLAWAVTGFMGVVSTMFYVLMSWLPEIMRDHGQSAATAGTMVSFMIFVGIPLGYLVPVLTARLRDQRPPAAGIGVIMAAGVGGLLLFPHAAWVWVSVLGVGVGAAFPFAFTLLSLRAPTPAVAARLSGMAQTGGYLLAGLGPLGFGVLHSVTGGWTLSLVALLALTVPETLLGLVVGRPRFVRTVVSRRSKESVDAMDSRDSRDSMDSMDSMDDLIGLEEGELAAGRVPQR
jgi:CP family cyanate transporter-like MFS transporter